MSEIKSALEIALERTANIKSDSAAGKSRELQNEGKKIVSSFMQTFDEKALKKDLNSFSSKEKAEVTKGAINLLLTRIQLPTTEHDIETTIKIGNVLNVILPHNNISEFFGTVEQIFMQFLSMQSQLEESLMQQFAPKMRKKEMELEQRTGQKISLSPTQDPEFMQMYNRSNDQLKAQYEEAIEKVREKILLIAQNVL